ncbi:hypothetical protein [Vibrio cincinnatiensis]|uniref:hypothetical protein n=1 Tax=Vibrio cincinnatiensis TaxID=675 RepID=UPI001EE13313|nr:hypothetical protein [Vibrio cincinnatiensis]MCG3741593.1 hypothetical protein [Vibrio cincinnatiensis]
MAIYQCIKCSEPICKRDAKFCTQCGEQISNPVPPQFLIDGKKTRWNMGLIAFWVVWALGGLALLINAQNSTLFVVVLGVVGFISGGIYISKSGSIKKVTRILIDSRTIKCGKGF